MPKREFPGGTRWHSAASNPLRPQATECKKGQRENLQYDGVNEDQVEIDVRLLARS
jgi:hypothetical protein